MRLMQFINNFYKKKTNFLLFLRTKKIGTFNFNPLVFLSSITFFSILFFATENLINKKKKRKQK